MKKIFFTVTNDLTYDQRMNRICTSLAENGYEVILVGRKLSGSLPLRNEKYRQKRLRCWFNKGKLFYAEYNTRLFFYLLFQKMDAICAIDLDTILPCLKISQWKKVPRVYDAHELFTELKEVVSRPRIKKMWTGVEKHAVPKYEKGYTVSESIAEEFEKRYGVRYKTIRNVARLKPVEGTRDKESSFAEASADKQGTGNMELRAADSVQHLPSKFILYQGAVNEARGFEYLIPAMKWIDAPLVVCGDGNFMEQLKELIRVHEMEHKVELKGMLPPAELWKIAQQAYMGIAVAENEGLNQYYALPNKFFDYIHAGLPQVTMSFPEYKKINKQFEVAILIDDLAPQRIAAAINNLLADDVIYGRLKQNCLKARQELNWQNEEKKLLAFYQSIFNT
jgi:glycosyltransferase involved in cell wall biosynthesis